MAFLSVHVQKRNKIEEDIDIGIGRYRYTEENLGIRSFTWAVQ